MHIDENDITKLENLSYIKVEDKPKMLKELEGVIAFMDNLKNFNLEINNIDENNNDIYREDIPVKNDVFSKLDKNNIEEKCFVVPKIIS